MGSGGGGYILEFQSRIVDRQPTAPAESVTAGNVTLTFVEEKDMYRGSGLLGYQTGPPPNRTPLYVTDYGSWDHAFGCRRHVYQTL